MLEEFIRLMKQLNDLDAVISCLADAVRKETAYVE